VSRGGAFYDSPEWKKARARHLAMHRTCEAPGCGTPSKRVDHKLAISRGGGALDPENFQALCEKCHNAKTARVDGGFGNPKTDGVAFRGAGADGRPLDPRHHWNKPNRK
jgi:5-methylcytosine-specific restriction protein A